MHCPNSKCYQQLFKHTKNKIEKHPTTCVRYEQVFPPRRIQQSLKSDV
jgi:hypothetical protein